MRKPLASEIKLFLNVLEEPELREMAVSSAMDVAECDEQEMEKILADYLSHAEHRLIREEAKGITEKLAEAERLAMKRVSSNCSRRRCRWSQP